MAHIPVLKNEVIHYLNPKPNENFIDCTVGEGGHALSILDKIAPKGKVLGIEVDKELYEILRSRIENERLILVRDSYRNLKEIIKKEKFKAISGILFDLGLSSWHLEESKRGFSFKENEPLDMRYDEDNALTAEKIVNHWSEKEMEEIFEKYGEEKFSRNIARRIIERRPIRTTLALAKVIKESTPDWYHYRRIHFATRVFQALRIVVNKELENLEETLPQAMEMLEKNGRLIVISFQSLEDRIVKNFFRDNAKKSLAKISTNKPIGPSLDEIKNNPRARSAKLRALIKQQ